MNTPSLDPTATESVPTAPFRLDIVLRPSGSKPVLVQRDLTEAEALTFLTSFWDSVRSFSGEGPAEYLQRLRGDSRQFIKVRRKNFGFYFYPNVSNAPPTVSALSK